MSENKIIDGYYVHRTVIISTWVNASSLEDPKNIHEVVGAAIDMEYSKGEYNEQETEVEVIYKPVARGKAKQTESDVLKYDEDRDYTDWFKGEQKDR